jgi:hypothetical protein
MKTTSKDKCHCHDFFNVVRKLVGLDTKRYYEYFFDGARKSQLYLEMMTKKIEHDLYWNYRW